MGDEVDREEPKGDEGRFAATWQNKAAGRALRVARQSLGQSRSKQSVFAATLSDELKVQISPTTLSGWETGRRQVPASVWIAAAMTSNQSLDAILGESGAPEVAVWAEALGLTARLDALTDQIETLKADLREVRQQYADLHNDVIDTLARAGLPYRTQGRPKKESTQQEADRRAANS